MRASFIFRLVWRSFFFLGIVFISISKVDDSEFAIRKRFWCLTQFTMRLVVSRRISLRMLHPSRQYRFRISSTDGRVIKFFNWIKFDMPRQWEQKMFFLLMNGCSQKQLTLPFHHTEARQPLVTHHGRALYMGGKGATLASRQQQRAHEERKNHYQLCKTRL